MILRTGTPQEAGFDPAKLKLAEDYAESWVSSGDTTASVVLVARHGIIVTHKAFGKAGPEEDAGRIEKDTIFPLGSVTKPITATCAMILHDRGILNINDPVQKYLPEFVGEGKDQVRIHHLMTHSSGLNDEVANEHAESKGELIVPEPESTQHPRLNEYLHYRWDCPLWKKPGEEMSYCNYGVQLLGEIVRRGSKQTIQDFAEKNIFQPLGMENTFYIVPKSHWHKVIRRSEDMEGGHWFVEPDALETPSASGGAYSTPSDMAVFCQMFLNKGIYNGVRILKEETVNEMVKNQIPGLGAKYGEETFQEASWGYCWDVASEKYKSLDKRSTRAFVHHGYGGEFIMADPEYDLVIVCFFVQKMPPFFDLSPLVTKVIESISE